MFGNGDDGRWLQLQRRLVVRHDGHIRQGESDGEFHLTRRSDLFSLNNFNDNVVDIGIDPNDHFVDDQRVHGVGDDTDARVVRYLHVDVGPVWKHQLSSGDVSDELDHGVEGDTDGVVDGSAVEDLW